jgi:PhzF family phenazine biosynthesis protein
MQYHIIDAFTDKLFGGNQAGVCLLEEWLPDDMLQKIAAENNLPETAFLVKQDDFYDLRWFSPEIEIDLCGHATLASAFVLFEEIESNASEIRFKTMSGMMAVKKENGLLYLDFPSQPVTACPMYSTFEKAFGVRPVYIDVQKSKTAQVKLIADLKGGKHVGVGL